MSKKTVTTKLTPISRSLKAFRLCSFIAVAIGASTQTSSLSAGLDGLLQGMYSNASGAGYFNAQQRGVLTGGSFVARVPIKPINIMSFDPPRVSSGCGGINLYGGSFSFINAQELTALLRAIAQNALGLLFHLGINAISQPLSSMLTTWSKKIQEMNALLRNSCEAARKLFTIDREGKAIAEEFKQAKDQIKTSFGDFKDSFSSAAERYKDSWKELRPDGADTSSEKAIKADPKVGNTVHRALIESSAADVITFGSSVADKAEARNLLMNLTGTEVYDVTDPASTNCKGSSANCEPKRKVFNPTLTFEDLIAPDPKKNSYFMCNGNDESPTGCTKLLEGKTLDSMYKGIRYELNKALYGVATSEELDQSAIIAAISSNKGIVGKSKIANPTLDATESKFVANDPFYSVTYFTKFSAHPNQVATLSVIIRKLTERKMAIELATKLLQSAQGIYSGSSVTASKPAEFDSNLAAFRTDLSSRRLQTPIEINEQLSIQQYSNLLLASLTTNGSLVPQTSAQ